MKKAKSKPKLSTGKKLRFLATFVALFIIAPLLLAEGGLRGYIWMKHGVDGKSYGLWRADDVLGAIHAENAYNTQTQTNDYGFRNREAVREPKPNGALRVVAYGGSTTFCYNLADEDAWPRQLEVMLREKHHPEDQVLNAGAILWSLGHAYARAKRDLPRLKPDVVIIYAGINEEANADHLKLMGTPLEQLVAEQTYGAFATNMDQNRWAKRNVALVRVFDYLVKSKFIKPPPPKPDESKIPRDAVLENYRHVLSDFLDLIVDIGAKPVFVVQAHGRNNVPNERRTSYSRQAIDIARERNAVVIDADVLVQHHAGEPMDLFYTSGVHFSKLGAAKVAEMVFTEGISTQFGGQR